ncbi:MAG: hypothetical protein HRT66_08765 [Flavobacteriaceae bacterium]|nr:hypothetical protein [Flavobacteriaceae bacterium]
MIGEPDQYTARVLDVNINDIDDITELMTLRGSTITETDILAVLNYFSL